jgi:phage shock protein PspC (stress-responsive transcriptional regulator)
MRKIGELLRDIFGVDGKQTVSFAGIFFKILGFLVLGFILYIIISYFVSKEGNFIFRKKTKQ